MKNINRLMFLKYFTALIPLPVIANMRQETKTHYSTEDMQVFRGPIMRLKTRERTIRIYTEPQNNKQSVYNKFTKK